MRANRFSPETGLIVLNAVATSGKLLGSCALRIGYRHSEFVLGDDGWEYGAAAAGPAYFWPDEGSPWILVLRSMWVRPQHRRAGIARRFAAYAQSFGLPTYLAFANKNVEAWFDEQYRPTGPSAIQQTIATAMRTPFQSEPPERDPDFTVYAQAEACCLRLWRSWHGGDANPVDLDRVLLAPDRADVWAVDSGEVVELGFSDSAFAADRRFGYVLDGWCDTWGAACPFDELPNGASEEDFETAEAEYERGSSFLAGALDVWVTDAEAMCAYASVRHFLRTLRHRTFNDVGDAAEELFAADLGEEPRGLRRFNALLAPAARHRPTSSSPMWDSI